MLLLLDILGYFAVLVRGLIVATQGLVIGGIVFEMLLVRPLLALHPGEAAFEGRVLRLLGWSAVAVLLVQALSVWMEVTSMVLGAGVPLADSFETIFNIAGFVKMAAALLIAVLAWRRPAAPGPGRLAALGSGRLAALCGLGLLVLAGTVATSHAAARLDGRALAILLETMHEAAASVWIGGILFFIVGIAWFRSRPAATFLFVRFSAICTVALAALLAGGVGLSLAYIDSVQAIWGTAYGVMVSTKVALFGLLLCLGAGNFLLIRRLQRDPAVPTLRVRRFAEVELGIGLTVFFAAASLTSLPPATDLRTDRVTLQQIWERNSPKMPVLASPDRALLAIPQALASEAAHQEAVTREAPRLAEEAAIDSFDRTVPPPRNLSDIAWSEYNHHWAGIIVFLVGMLALAERSGILRSARNWPLLFVVMAVFLFFRSDPEAWPLGQFGFWDTMLDPEVVQHRIFVVLIAGFGLFEWAVRTGRLTRPGYALVFPLLTALGGMLLLTHSHAIANVAEALLIEITHTPLAILGIVAGWSRWIELRLPGREGNAAAWVWPICFVLVGFILLEYREA